MGSCNTPHPSQYTIGPICNSNKMLSYRRETALLGGLVMAQNGRLERGDNIYGHYRSIFNHCDVIGRQSSSSSSSSSSVNMGEGKAIEVSERNAK